MSHELWSDHCNTSTMPWHEGSLKESFWTESYTTLLRMLDFMWQEKRTAHKIVFQINTIQQPWWVGIYTGPAWRYLRFGMDPSGPQSRFWSIDEFAE